MFPARDPASLRAVFQHIDHMRPVRVKPGASTLVPWDAPFAAAGLVLALAATAALFGLRFQPW